jgi:hypothetical protein
MRRGWTSTLSALAAMALLGCPAALAAAPCDEADPSGPAQSAQIVLTATDFVDETHDELRSFIATDSLGRVDLSVVASRPSGVVRSITAIPQMSRYSPLYGEALKGIAVAVSVARTSRSVSVIVSLRQVCAKYFRNSFLYY